MVDENLIWKRHIDQLRLFNGDDVHSPKTDLSFPVSLDCGSKEVGISPNDRSTEVDDHTYSATPLASSDGGKLEDGDGKT